MIKIYIKNNGMNRVYYIGIHPVKDFIAISRGGNDITWISYYEFHTNYKEDK